MLLLGTQKTIQKYPKITVAEWEAHGFEAGTSIVSAQMMVKFEGWFIVRSHHCNLASRTGDWRT
jgi:hypothetical protein